MTRVGVLKETGSGENRVAISPDVVAKLQKKGISVAVEKGAGEKASLPDSVFEKAGAEIVDRDQLKSISLLFSIQVPDLQTLDTLDDGLTLISLLGTAQHDQEFVSKVNHKRFSFIALEKIPRITRAQSMDVLSSQANLAGYRAVIEAAHVFGSLFPMMMTAAGSVPPARVLVLGVGVAGLQAIATAKRLGGRVEAFDVRPEVREQIISVGAKPVDLDLGESGAGEGGYAKALSEEAQERQKAELAKVIARSNIVITTAQIPGKKAPVLITEDAVSKMAPGSVIVDLAAGSGGNCPLTKADELVNISGVSIIGYTNLPSRMPNTASQFFARNLLSLLEILVYHDDSGHSELKIDIEDEIISSALVYKDGEEFRKEPS